MAEVGASLLRLQAWHDAWATGQVAAFREANAVTVVNRAGQAVELPLTGTRIGEDYGGMRSGWVRIDPGTTVFESAASG